MVGLDEFVPPVWDQSPPSGDGHQTMESKQRGVTVEEIDDEEAPSHGGRYAEAFPAPAGESFGERATLFEALKGQQNIEGESRWAPFKDRDEWELAEWLMKNVGQNKTDEFLKLPIVSGTLSTILICA